METFFYYLHSVFNITIRSYRNSELRSVFGNICTPDTVTPYLPLMLQTQSRVAQVVTRTLHCYGVVKAGDGTAYVIGPAVRMRPDDVEMKELALELHRSGDGLHSLRSYLDTLPLISLTRFADMLCMINSALGGKDVQPEKILLGEMPASGQADDLSAGNDLSVTNYMTEKQLMSLIRRGDADTLKKVMMSTQYRQDFNIANDSVRNIRNILIVSTTLASRAAIEGGLEAAKAFDLSDMYIRTVETLKDPGEIYALMARMVMDFAGRVGSCVLPDGVSPVIASCLRFIRRNISQPVSLKNIAAHAKMSSGYLSTVFKKEVGLSLSDYITVQRIEEAKHLLDATDRTLSDISNYLCFSSQSYFQNVFKKITGMTPMEYKTSKTG